MKRYKKLIFVDADDTSRAPMAKVIMKTKPLFRPIEIDSRGLVVLFSQPINQKAEAVLISNGYSAKDHASAALSSRDIGEDTLILTMEEEQREKDSSDAACDLAKRGRPDKRAHGGAGDYEPFRVSAQDGSGRLYYSSGYRRYSGNGAASADLF